MKKVFIIEIITILLVMVNVMEINAHMCDKGHDTINNLLKVDDMEMRFKDNPNSKIAVNLKPYNKDEMSIDIDEPFNPKSMIEIDQELYVGTELEFDLYIDLHTLDDPIGELKVADTNLATYGIEVNLDDVDVTPENTSWGNDTKNVIKNARIKITHQGLSSKVWAFFTFSYDRDTDTGNDSFWSAEVHQEFSFIIMFNNVKDFGEEVRNTDALKKFINIKEIFDTSTYKDIMRNTKDPIADATYITRGVINKTNPGIYNNGGGKVIPREDISTNRIIFKEEKITKDNFSYSYYTSEGDPIQVKYPDLEENYLEGGVMYYDSLQETKGLRLHSHLRNHSDWYPVDLLKDHTFIYTFSFIYLPDMNEMYTLITIQGAVSEKKFNEDGGNVDGEHYDSYDDYIKGITSTVQNTHNQALADLKKATEEALDRYNKIMSGKREERSYTDVLSDISYYTNIGNISSDEANKVETTVGKILSIITNIGIVISVLIPAILGVKYMLGSVEEKAEYKKDIIPYLVGAVMLFAICTVIKILQSIGEQINSI